MSRSKGNLDKAAVPLRKFKRQHLQQLENNQSRASKWENCKVRKDEERENHAMVHVVKEKHKDCGHTVPDEKNETEQQLKPHQDEDNRENLDHSKQLQEGKNDSNDSEMQEMKNKQI